MGLPQAYGIVHYLDDSLLDDYSFPVKKLHHKTISHLFCRMDDIRGHKDNIYTTEKNQIKFCIRFPEIILSFQHSQNIKKNRLETQINARNNKRQNLSIKIAADW
jgi:hypothetical protein